ncbi:MAG: hypothetical protein MUF43_13550 [Flavobacterium sp.]|jgi:hypothetical protein|nr:hypothetical protein [Flavobacterium sp.]
MENETRLKLPTVFSNYLENLPEKGMGYQIVDIELLDGQILVDRIVFNSTYLKLNENEKIQPEKIKNVKVKLK